MPYTAKARRYFHAAAARGEEGMAALASEADTLAKQGKERPPVKDGEGYAHGGMVCEHCGAELGEDGYAKVMTEAGSVDEAAVSLRGMTDEPTEQGVAGERMRDAAFADSLRRRRGGG